MKIHRINIKNFRLLRNINLLLEDRTTLIVGRNNSGKTSLAELFRRLLSEKSPKFKLEDFSLGAHEEFWHALELLRAESDGEQIRQALPIIEVRLTFSYNIDSENLGALSEFIVDLDPECNEAVVVFSFAPIASKVKVLLDGFQIPAESVENDKSKFFRAIKDRIQACYEISVEAIDPSDGTNRKSITWSILTSLIQSDFINAQRGLDDITNKDREVLGKVLELLFSSATADSADIKDKLTAQELTKAVDRMQEELQKNFNTNLSNLFPTFNLFGYPGLGDPRLVTETTLDVERLLTNHTKVRYEGINGFTLPEAYNGLGTRNLIYILLQLFGFFRSFRGRSTLAGVHLIFIEEPEAHLHPQMQEVFIRQIEQIAAAFELQLSDGAPWPVQFVVSTHSPHMANASRFEAMRYFLSRLEGPESDTRAALVKDLRSGFSSQSQTDRDFLHQYLTLTRCDLFFADKAILIEGTSERLMLPKMIDKIDVEKSPAKLGSQYVTIMEVGGAYAHRFFKLLDFLEIHTLIITDLDSVMKAGGEACKVSDGSHTSNACIKSWFDPDVSPAELIGKSPEHKTKGLQRIAYQIPEKAGAPCGRSFEDAFILANSKLFGIPADNENDAWNLAQKQKKSEFAIKHAIDVTDWVVPKYIGEGLRWLKGNLQQSSVSKAPNDEEVALDQLSEEQLEVVTNV